MEKQLSLYAGFISNVFSFPLWHSVDNVKHSTISNSQHLLSSSVMLGTVLSGLYTSHILPGKFLCKPYDVDTIIIPYTDDNLETSEAER